MGQPYHDLVRGVKAADDFVRGVEADRYAGIPSQPHGRQGAYTRRRAPSREGVAGAIS